MRNLLIALAAVIAVPAMPAAPAEACGPYMMEPEVMPVSTHFTFRDDGGGRRRTFVILGNSAPEGLAWTPLAPRSYDTTQIAAAPLLDAPVELTLVGPSGMRTVKLRKQVYLAASWRWQEPVSALEVEVGEQEDFRFAMWGAKPAAWRALESGRAGQADVAWLAAQGVRVADAGRIYLQRVRGSDVEIVAAFAEGGALVTFVRRGEVSVGRYEGSASYAFAQRGRGWLVLEQRGQALRTVSLGMLPAA